MYNIFDCTTSALTARHYDFKLFSNTDRYFIKKTRSTRTKEAQLSKMT